MSDFVVATFHDSAWGDPTPSAEGSRLILKLAERRLPWEILGVDETGDSYAFLLIPRDAVDVITKRDPDLSRIGTPS